MSSAFAHLRLHSEYDVRKGAARLSHKNSIINHAASLGYPSLALTDTACMSGAVKFYTHCRKKGIKPIIGCELKIGEQNNDYLLLLCMNQLGYENLSRLLSQTCQGLGYMPLQQITPASTQGIIALSGGKRGRIYSYLSADEIDTAHATVKTMKKLFPDRFYLEAWNTDSSDAHFTSVLSHISDLADVPLVATHPIQCTYPDDIEMLNTRLCIANANFLNDSHREKPICDEPYLLAPEVMCDKFVDYPGALNNTIEIVKRCNFAFKLNQTLLPTINNEDISVEDSLKKFAKAGLEKKIKNLSYIEDKTVYTERLDYELEVINKMEFADYFLIVMDFIKWSKENNIPVGPGRGSGAGSLVAYALDITTVDPIYFSLLFERFLNPDRVSMPDFDIDFCVDGRDKVIQYVEQKYGSDRVSQIITFGTIGAKSAIRDVGRVLGMPYGQCDRIAKTIPNAVNVTLEEALKESTAFADCRNDDEEGRLIELALKLEGLPRNIGTHAGGVLIAPDAIDKFCPTTISNDSKSPISQFDMIDIEKIGLVKFDFLGLRTLTIISHAEKYLHLGKLVPDDFNIENIPLDDKKVYQLYSSGEMAGVFQCESSGMCRLMKQLQPDRFSDIIALMALYRPGPIEAGSVDSYIKRKHGEQAIDYPHECTKSVLEETYGVFIYQEQIMQVARSLAGYSLAEADLLRRAMGKKKEEEMAAQQDRFVKGSSEKLAKDKATELFTAIQSFAGYGFNKSHATAYALLSYRTAYLKTHYPAIFLAAVMSAESGVTDNIKTLIKEAKRLGVKVLKPDVNISRSDFYATKENDISYGLLAIKGMGFAAASSIVTQRKKTPYKNIFDFCQRIKVDAAVSNATLDTLATAGAFDCFDENRLAIKKTLPSASQGQSLSASLFADTPTLVDSRNYTLQEKLCAEENALGFAFSSTFYDIYKNILLQLPLNPTCIKKIIPKTTVTFAATFIKITQPSWLRKSNLFLVLVADDTHDIEVVVQAECQKYLKSNVHSHDLLMISGKAVSRQNETVQIKGTIITLNDYMIDNLRHATINCEDSSVVTFIKKNLFSEEVKNPCEVILAYKENSVSFNVSLQKKWAVSYLTYQRLCDTIGSANIRLSFTG